MQIIKLVVKAGKTVGNPHESYSNLRSDVVIEAIPDLDEHWDRNAGMEQLRAMQEQADEAVEAELRRRLEDLENAARMAGIRDEIGYGEITVSRHREMAKNHRDRIPEADIDVSKMFHEERARSEEQLADRFERDLAAKRIRLAALEAGQPDPGETPAVEIGEDEDGDPG